MRKEDIKNPGRWITGNQTLLYRAQESCGRCHQRGEGKAQFSDPTFGTVKLHVEAPSDLAAGFTNKAIFPVPGDRLLNFMSADLTNTKIWDTAKNNIRSYDGTNTFFPSYLASSGHHQQWEDMEQGMKKTAGGAANGMTCFTCHDPHAATPGGIRATMTVVSDLDGQTYTINTSAQDNTLCFSCHSEYNSFSNLDRSELAANNIAEMAAAVDNHVRSKYRANLILGTPAKRITVANYLSDLRKDGAQAKYGRIVYKNGQCISCHMPATASSAATFLDLQGRKQGDIRSHTFATIWAAQKNAENAGAPAGAPSSCSGCHTTTN